MNGKRVIKKGRGLLGLLCMAMFAMTLSVTGCSSDDDTYEKAALTVEPKALSVPITGETVSFKITSNRAWKIEKTDDWCELSADKGEAGEVTVSVTVKANPGKGRSANLKVVASSLDETVIVTQAGTTGTSTKVTIADVLKEYADGKVYTGDNHIEGEIVLNPVAKNVPDFVAYICDGTAGIAMTFDDKENIAAKLPLGAKVRVYVKDVKFKNFSGLIQFGDGKTLKTTQTEILEVTPTTPLAPRVVTMAEITSGEYQAELVEIADVQFVDPTLTYNGVNGNQKIETCGGEQLALYTRKDAEFQGQAVMQGKGKFVGVVGFGGGAPQVIIRKVADLAGMTGDRCLDIVLSEPTVFTAAGGTQDITVTIPAGAVWNVEVTGENSSWCTVSPATGTGAGTFTLTAAANTGAAQTAIVQVTSGGSFESITVSQQGVVAGDPNELFISEYVEGSANNKYIEIYNPTNAGINLSAYSIQLQTNGAGLWGQKSGLPDVVLASKSVIIFKHAQAAIYTGEATALSAINFNGNDPVGLFKGETLIDVVGKFDGGAADFAKDMTFKRKSTVKFPYAVGSEWNKDEWEQSAKDDVSGLGSHTMN